MANREFRDGDLAVFDHTRTASSGPNIGKQVTQRHVAIRRGWGWGDQWQVAIHGFWRVSDDFVAERAVVIGNVDEYQPIEQM